MAVRPSLDCLRLVPCAWLILWPRRSRPLTHPDAHRSTVLSFRVPLLPHPCSLARAVSQCKLLAASPAVARRGK